MRLGIIRHERHVRAAEHDGDAARTECGRHLVRARRGSGDDREADDVGGQIAIDVLDAFIDELEIGVEPRRHERGERRQRQRRVTQGLPEDAATMAIQRPLR